MSNNAAPPHKEGTYVNIKPDHDINTLTESLDRISIDSAKRQPGKVTVYRQEAKDVESKEEKEVDSTIQRVDDRAPVSGVQSLQFQQQQAVSL